MIVVCIVAIGFVSQAQLAQKNETSPLYEFRAAQAVEEFGLAPSGSANSDLELGSVTTAELTIGNTQVNSDTTTTKKPSYRPKGTAAGPKCHGKKTMQTPLPKQTSLPPKSGTVICRMQTQVSA